MRKRSIIIIMSISGLALLASATLLLTLGTDFSGKRVSSIYTVAELAKKFGKSSESAKNERQDIRAAMQWMAMLRASNPTDNSLDPKYVIQARQQIMAMRHSRNGDVLGLKWEELGPDNVGGRTRAILIDKDNSNLIYAGSVTGGLWVSTDGALTWHKHSVNDELGNHSISSIVQARNGDIYYGTGESYVYTEQNTYGHLGGGIYKSTDGGATFTVLPATNLSPDTATAQWSYVNALALRYDNTTQGYAIYAATNKGLQLSNDGGQTWSPIAGPSNADINGRCTDVKVGSNGTVHTALNNHYYHAEDGYNFTNIDVFNFPTTNISFIVFDVSPQDPLYVYAAIANQGALGCGGCGPGLNGVYRSTDGGFNWLPYSPINSTAFNPYGDQGDYNDLFAVSPVNKNKVFIGGQLELWSGGNDIGWNKIATAGGGETYQYYIHADEHAIAFDPKDPNTMYIGSDGGIAKTINAQDEQPNFSTRNQGYFTTQFYGMDASVDGEVMAGAQDNGTSYIDFHQNTQQSSFYVASSDGGQTYISKSNSNILFATDQFGLYRSSNKGTTFGPFADAWLTTLQLYYPFERPYTVWEGDTVRYDTLVAAVYDTISPAVVVVDSLGQRDTISPAIYNVVVPGIYDTINPGNSAHNKQPTSSILMLGAYAKVVFTRDALDFNNATVWYSINVSGIAYAIAAGRDGTFYVGTDNGHIYMITGLKDENHTHYNPSAHTFTGATIKSLGQPCGSRLIDAIAVDPHDSHHIVVALSGYGYTNNVYESFNTDAAGPTFTSIQGTLPPMPVYGAVIDFYNPNNVIVGTDMGMWARNDPNTNEWGEENVGLSSIPIYKVVQTYLYDTACQVVYASSYGNGMFRTTTLTTGNNANCNLATGIKEPSPTQAVTVNSVKVYPNPASDRSIVELDIAQATEVKITVLDILGRVYQAKDYGQLNGKQSLQLDVSSLTPGNYFVSVQTGDKTSSKPILIMR